MSKSIVQDAQARRALIEDIKEDRRSWLQHGLAALGVSLLGLGVASSVALTGNAESAQVAVPAAQVRTSAEVAPQAAALPQAFDRDARPTRDAGRQELDPARLKSLADQRAEELSKTDAEIDQAAKVKAADARTKSLSSASKATEQEGAKIIREKAEAAARAAAAAAAARAEDGNEPRRNTPAAPAAPAPAPAPDSGGGGGGGGGGKSCMPITSGYSVAARFGQVGSWSRYHTGYDFSASVGTTLRASAPGVVTNAGSGRASGWAGNYVAIRHSDGTSSMMAHMSTVSVSVGQSVSACQVVGAVGMTGRTFGPHVHFEIYPAGVTPGDVYNAVDPVAWLRARGLNP